MKRFTFLLLSILVSINLLFPDYYRDGLGDVNNDGVINIQDIIRSVNIILENDPPPTDYELWSCDVNVDDLINISDIIVMVSIILGTQCIDPLYQPCDYDLSDCCLINTSHITEWEIDTLGHSPTYLHDVEIVSEDNIYVVGKINFDNDYNQYNMAHWDGENWEYQQIIGPTELYSIYYFNEDDIWVTDWGSPIHWNDEEWTMFHLQNMGLDVSVGQDIWGTSSNNMYFVGHYFEHGNIVHYDGENFTEIELGLDTDFQCIDGTPDGEHIFVTGYQNPGNQNSYLVEYNSGSWDVTYYYNGYYPVNDSTGAVLGVAVHADTAYIARTGGFWKYNFLTGESVIEPNEITDGYKHYIINEPDDIFMMSGLFSILHFDGESWLTDDSINDHFGWSGVGSGNFDYYNNTLVLTGTINSWFGKEVVIRGSR